MEDRLKYSSDGEPVEEFGLRFEIGRYDDAALVFDAPDAGDSESSGVTFSPISTGLEFVSDISGSEDSPAFEAPAPAPMYVPRFTGASERYRSTRIRQSAAAEKTDEAAISKKPEVDPTSEADDARVAPHVVVSSASVKSESADESIVILKFKDGESEDAPPDPDEIEFEALRSAVREAVSPKASEPVTEAVEDTPEEISEETIEEKAANLADPYAELMLVDYNAAASGAEDISSEEAPDEYRGTGRLGEFKRPAERDVIKDRFLDRLMSIKIRLAGALIMLLLASSLGVLKLFSIDLLALIGVGSVTYAAAVVDLQLSACLVLFAVPEIIRALGNLINRTVSPELAIPISAAAVILHSITVISTHATDYPSFAPLLGIQVVFAILASLYRVNADFRAFKLVSRGRIKNILDKRLTRTLPRENVALDGAVDEYNSKIARLFRAAFISDFFKRSSEAVENSLNNVIMLLGGLGVALTSALITWLVGGGAFSDFTAPFAFILLVSFPAFSMLIHKLPHDKCAETVEAENGAFVGERSIFASSDIDVIAYDDVEIFGAEDISIKKVHLYGKAYNAGKAMQQMYAIFSAVGGPLADIFASSVDAYDCAAVDIAIEDDGISARLGDKRIAAGTLAYMQRNGIRIPDGDPAVTSADSTRTMYGAEDGEVYVRFSIRYFFSEDFASLLPALKDAGVVPLIYTRDPNVSLELFRTLTMGEDVIRVMKKHTVPTGDEKIYRRVSAGIVTLGSKLDAVNMVLLAKRYGSFQASLSASELIAMIASAAIAVVFSVGGSLVVPTLALSLLQLLLGAYLYLRTRYSFNDKKKKGNQ